MHTTVYEKHPKSCACFFRLSELLKPLLGRTRSRGRCWTAIQLSHRPGPSGHAVRGGSMDRTLEDNMVDGLFFCATLTGRCACWYA